MWWQQNDFPVVGVVEQGRLRVRVEARRGEVSLSKWCGSSAKRESLEELCCGCDDEKVV